VIGKEDGVLHRVYGARPTARKELIL
jgi:hypothetical protein